MNKIKSTMAILIGSAAIHVAAVACNGSESGTAQAGGSGGSPGNAPIVVTIPCDATGLAKATFPGKTALDLAHIVALAHAKPSPNNAFDNVQEQVSISDGVVGAACNATTFDQVTFVLR